MSQFEFILAREAQLMYRRAREFQPVDGNLTRWRGLIPGRGYHKDMNFEVEITIPPEFPQNTPIVTMITPTEHPQVDPSTGNLTLRILTYWRLEYHLYQVVNSIKGLFARIPPKLPDTFASTLVPPPAPPTPFQSFPSIKDKAAPPTPFEPIPVSIEKNIVPPSPFQPSPPPKEEMVQAHSPILEIPAESSKVKELKSQISGLESELAQLQKSLMSKTEEVTRLEGRMDVHNVPRTGPNRINDILLPKNDKESQLLDLQSEKIALEDLIQNIETKFEMGELSSTEYAKLYKSYQKQLHQVNQKLKEKGINQNSN